MKSTAGLGLAIAQQLLVLMGSRLELASTPGVGSRFSFDLHLPPAHGEVASLGETAPRITSLAPGHTVDALVVDDVRENREVLAGLLRAIGVQVRLADSEWMHWASN